jgi:hypothetical protein
MTEMVCNFATIRFLPYRETGEFVNVGVVAHCPEVGFLDFRLLGKKTRRVSAFFPELDRAVFRQARDAMALELVRQRAASGDDKRRLVEFHAMTSRRESLLHFTPLRSKLISGSPSAALEAIYKDQVERSFAQSKEYRDTQLARRFATMLRAWDLYSLFEKNKRLGTAEYHLQLPFVRRDERLAIKPMDLDRSERTDVLNHGDSWVLKIRRLSEVGFDVGKIVFPVRFPAKGPKKAAADEIAQALLAMNVKVVPIADRDRLRELTAA